MNLPLPGFLISIPVGLLTSLGAVPILFSKHISQKWLDISLGFAAGVMLSITAFGLLAPAAEVGGIWATLVGFAVGVLFLVCLDHFTPHSHLIGGLEGGSSALDRARLIIVAIAIHNFPEGTAVGTSYGCGETGIALAVAISMGLHNIAEGMACALPLAREGYSRRRVFWYTTLAGLVTAPGGLFGALAVTLARVLLPYGMAFAAGAMLYVVLDEMVPECSRKGHQFEATLGAVVGFALMMVLESLLT